MKLGSEFLERNFLVKGYQLHSNDSVRTIKIDVDKIIQNFRADTCLEA